MRRCYCSSKRLNFNLVVQSIIALSLVAVLVFEFYPQMKENTTGEITKLTSKTKVTERREKECNSLIKIWQERFD